ncbi:FecR domain-containing protein [Pseudomonas solani]|uniref:FecR domain-containing protein n=1 Tax=Pseudomonas solani TaxID=2731552 RepID=UPI003C2B6D97
MSPAPDFSTAVAEQAVRWLIEMQDGPLNPAQQLAWQQWHDAHGEHQRAWQHILRASQRMRGLSSPLAHATLNAPTSAGRRQALKLLLILGAGSAATWAVRERDALAPMLADYRSRVGERRTLRLDDGSRLQLNTRSAVDVRFDREQRLVHLLEGEIMLTGAAASLPLRVRTAQGEVSLQAARVNLRQFERHTQLAVFDGVATLNPVNHMGAPLQLGPAQQLDFSADGWRPPVALDARSGAWSDGMLVAAHTRLADFLDELGRYRRGHLGCDAAVADLLVSGSYPLDDSERILELLEITLPVRVRRFTRYWVSLEARA